jgi:D-3-phosphoglycerate dehydrogenase/C-terminal binding protein
MPKKPLVVITDFINDDLEPERTALGEVADVVALDAYDEGDLAGRVEEADAVMLFHNTVISRPTIDRLTQCKLIVRCGVGVDNVDHAYARTRGLDVANVPDYGSEEVADSAIGMMLTLTRGIHQNNSRLRAAPVAAEDWSYTQSAPLFRLRGRTIGILGLGRIGTATALRAKALGMDVVFYDPFKPDGYDKALGIRRAESIEELLPQCFVLSLHSPSTEQTRGIINAATIAQMPAASYLINTARGAIVDTSAIPAAIASGQLAGAAIDVLATEPPSDNDPLLTAWRDPAHPAHHRVIVNPHAAFYSEEGLRDMRVKGAAACRRAILGEPVRTVIN